MTDHKDPFGRIRKHVEEARAGDFVVLVASECERMLRYVESIESRLRRAEDLCRQAEERRIREILYHGEG